MNVYKLTIVAMFASLTAIGAFIRIPIPYLPITLQVFFVFLAGILVGPRLGALSQIAYLILGLVGLPIFAEGGGFGYIFHPSFGFILGFVAVSFFVGYFLDNHKKLNFIKTFFISLIGLIILYIIGVPYMNLILNKVLGIEVTMLQSFIAMATLYLPGDILKIIGVALIAPRIRDSIRTSEFSS